MKKCYKCDNYVYSVETIVGAFKFNRLYYCIKVNSIKGFQYVCVWLSINRIQLNDFYSLMSKSTRIGIMPSAKLEYNINCHILI